VGKVVLLIIVFYLGVYNFIMYGLMLGIIINRLFYKDSFIFIASKNKMDKFYSRLESDED